MKMKEKTKGGTRRRRIKKTKSEKRKRKKRHTGVKNTDAALKPIVSVDSSRFWPVENLFRIDVLLPAWGIP